MIDTKKIKTDEKENVCVFNDEFFYTFLSERKTPHLYGLSVFPK